jgi:hypothetical protein
MDKNYLLSQLQTTGCSSLQYFCKPYHVCNLSFRSGFLFSEQDVHRTPSQPTQEGSDTSVSYYAIYPNGTRGEAGIPVSQQVLTEAIKEDLANIRTSTGLDSLSLAGETSPSEDDDVVDWPLALGLSLAGVLFLLMVIALVAM